MGLMNGGPFELNKISVIHLFLTNFGTYICLGGKLLPRPQMLWLCSGTWWSVMESIVVAQFDQELFSNAPIWYVWTPCFCWALTDNYTQNLH